MNKNNTNKKAFRKYSILKEIEDINAEEQNWNGTGAVIRFKNKKAINKIQKILNETKIKDILDFIYNLDKSVTAERGDYYTELTEKYLKYKAPKHKKYITSICRHDSCIMGYWQDYFDELYFDYIKNNLTKKEEEFLKENNSIIMRILKTKLNNYE